MKNDKFGEHRFILMKDAHFLRLLRILLYLKHRRKRNNAFTYLTDALLFEYSTIYRPINARKVFVLNYWTNED